MSTSPPAGSMYLYDNMTPPLPDNSYQLQVVTNVSAGALAPNSGFFNIEGPRFSLAATEVSGVVPPPNGHGDFHESFPQIALKRRTLPWERKLTSDLTLIGTPKQAPGDPPRPEGPAPWLALLLFEDGEYTINPNVPLEKAVPSDVYRRLNPPPGIACDTVQASVSLVSSIMPSLDELTLLAHVRQVNVDDRELNAGSSDGWFAVLISNRLPSPGAKYRACLVSLEERTDLVTKDPPAVEGTATAGTPGAAARAAVNPQANTGARVPIAATITSPAILAGPGDRGVIPGVGRAENPTFSLSVPTVQLVLLHSWQFECAGTGTFRDYMRRLNDSMFGTVEAPGHPPVTDTGHIPMTLADRAGVDEKVWYRGPLVPMPLTRDPLTYHSADQCRRVTPDTGAEDISYAAAFEAGRLLAVANARVAQELMRWRREAYRQSARRDCLSAVNSALPLPASLDLHSPVGPSILASASQSMLSGVKKVGDRYGIAGLGNVVGLNPSEVRQAWNLPTADEATAVLGGAAATTGAIIATPAQTARPNVTLAQVAADSAGLQNLTSARERIIKNTLQKLGGSQ